MKPTVERATMADLGTIARIHVECWREIYTFVPESVHRSRNLTYRFEQWQEVIKANRPGERLWTVCVDDEIIGFAHANDAGDTDIPEARALFNAAYFLPSVRKQSVGVHVMDAMIQFALEEDLWPACLWAFEDNPGRSRNAAAGWKEVVRRNRVIDGIAIPEVGYLSPADPQELYVKMTGRLHAGAPRTGTRPTSDRRPGWSTESRLPK